MGTWSLPSVPSAADVARATSAHPLIIGASPGTTGTMSLYFALKMLGISTVHYTRHYNATARAEYTTYGESPPGAPVPLIRPLFGDMPPTGGPPPLDLPAARHADLRFLNATDALIDTPSMDLFFELLATFPNARVVLTAREPRAWAASRRRRHPSDAAPLFAQLGFAVPVGAVTEDQARRSPDPPLSARALTPRDARRRRPRSLCGSALLVARSRPIVSSSSTFSPHANRMQSCGKRSQTSWAHRRPLWGPTARSHPSRTCDTART